MSHISHMQTDIRPHGRYFMLFIRADEQSHWRLCCNYSFQCLNRRGLEEVASLVRRGELGVFVRRSEPGACVVARPWLCGGSIWHSETEDVRRRRIDGGELDFGLRIPPGDPTADPLSWSWWRAHVVR